MSWGEVTERRLIDEGSESVAIGVTVRWFPCGQRGWYIVGDELSLAAFALWWKGAIRAVVHRMAGEEEM